MVKPIQTAPDAPWKQRFRAPGIFYSTIAPHAPGSGLVWTNLSGLLQFHAWDVASGELRQLTHAPGGQTQFLILSPDARWVYYLKDEGGNEIGHYVRMPYTGGDPVDITPQMPPYPSFGFSISESGNRLGFATADAQGSHFFVMDISADDGLGPVRKLYDCETIAFGPGFSADGSLAMVMTSERSKKNEFALLAFDAATGERLAELWDGEGTSISIQNFSRVLGDPRVLANTNRTGIETLLLWNPLTGERTDLPLETVPGSQNAHDWSPDGKQILFSAIHQAVQNLYLYNLEVGKLQRLDAAPGEYQPYFTPDGKEIYATWNDAAHPQRLVALDPQTGAVTRIVLAAGEVTAGREFHTVSFPSSDGQLIQGWLAVPEGEGPFPTILETHGGPTAVQGNGFSSGAQAWLDHGFAFLTINYRGSVTFGREFEQKIWFDVGHWEIEDMVAARDWLVQERIARPDAIFLTGWSYGGYLTLLGLGKRPDLWAGGMAGIAIADWAVQWEDTADTLRGYQEALFGGTPEQQPQGYRRSSPITYAEAVRAPLLIIQGRNDTRTPARPVELYEAKMKELGKPVTVHWFESGHAGSFSDVEMTIQHQQMMMQFAYNILK